METVEFRCLRFSSFLKSCELLAMESTFYDKAIQFVLLLLKWKGLPKALQQRSFKIFKMIEVVVTVAVEINPFIFNLVELVVHMENTKLSVDGLYLEDGGRLLT